jgi:hypothetical protein
VSGFIAIGGHPVVTAMLSLPHVGAWVLDATVDAQETSDVAGAVTVDLGDALELKGMATLDSEVFGGVAYVRVVGGAGGMTKTAPAKYYANPTLRIPLLDLLNASGEQLATTSDVNALNTQLRTWTTLAIGTGQAIGALVQAAPTGSVWRMLADGTVWVGQDAWKGTDAEYTILSERTREGRLRVSFHDAPTLLPGSTLEDGRKVSDVLVYATGDRVEADVWLA